MSDWDNNQDAGMAVSPALILGALWRRRYWILVPAILGTVVGVYLATSLPSVYRSQTTIMIEAAKVPQRFVEGSDNSFAAQRIESVRQMVISRSNLVRIIEKFELYADARRSEPISSIIDRMNKSINVALIDVRQGRGTATIAFTLSFDYPQPRLALRVTEELATQFVQLDSERRTELASGTAEFLSDQARALRRDLERVEQQMAAFKAENAGALPEQAAVNRSLYDSLQGELRTINTESAALAQEIAMLRSLGSTGGSPAMGSSELYMARQALAAAQARYSETHPDVIALRQRVEMLERSGGGGFASPGGGMSPEIEARISGNQFRLSLLTRRQGEIRGQLALLEQQLAAAPQVELELREIEREYRSTEEKYAALTSQQLSATVAANLESEEKGEKFSISEPPNEPDVPVSPNRPLLAGGGLVGGLVLGLGLAMLLELVNRRVRGTDAVTRIFGVPPLAVVPMLDVDPATMMSKPLPGLLARLGIRRDNHAEKRDIEFHVPKTRQDDAASNEAA